LTGSGRGTREVGGGADRWGPGVSGWARQLPGAGDAEARGCWAGHGSCWAARSWAGAERAAGLARLGCWRVAGPSGKRGGEPGWGWCWAAEKREGQRAECEEGEEMEGISFFFL